MAFTHDQYTALVNRALDTSVDRKLYYTHELLISKQLLCGTDFENTCLTDVDIWRLGFRIVALSNGKVIAGAYPNTHTGVADLIKKVTDLLHVYNGPSNEQLCAMLGLSQRSKVDIEELVTNCKNTRLNTFSVFRSKGGLDYIRHSGPIEIDQDSFGMLVATVEMSCVSSEATARVALAKAIKAKQSSE